MLLHLVNDEKFIDGIIEFFERISKGNNKFLAGVEAINKELKYIKKYKNDILIATYGSDEYKMYVGDIEKYDAVLIHFLDIFKADIVCKAPVNVIFVWMIWGGDAYRLFDYKLYDDLTLDVIRQINNKNLLKQFISDFYIYKKIQKRKKEQKRLKLLAAIRRMNYCTTIIPTEYNIFKTHLPLKAKYIPFIYGLKDFINNESFHRNLPGFNILVGNSGSPSNNHLWVFELLSKSNLSDRKVIVPLSYGNNEYIKMLLSKGDELLEDSFVPITDFLEFKEYVNILSNCSICIMNNFRQEGMGNVVLMFWLGARVYLRIENPAYQYFKDNGLLLYPICDNGFLFESLTSEEKLHNKKIIEFLYSEQRVVEQVKNLIQTVTNTNLNSKK